MPLAAVSIICGKVIVACIIINSLFTQGMGQETCDLSSNRCPLDLSNALKKYPNYANLDTTQLIERHGYPAEIHHVITEDGYVLCTQRIPYSSKSPLNTTTSKPPVFLMHGAFASSAQWFWQPPNRALVFMLVDAGYDVWLGNARGTSYSRGYVGPTPKPYWDFSFHEIGKYDLPAFINHIKNVTKHESIYYIGHSVGTTDFAIFASLRPDMQSSIRTYFAMSPIAYAGNMTNRFFRLISPILSQYLAQQTVSLLTGGPIVPEHIQSRLVDVTKYCTVPAIECSACSLGLLAIFGINPCQTNWTQLPGFLAHLPDSVSGKFLSHATQQFQYGTFKQYDYGRLINIQKYGSNEAPDYQWDTYNVSTVFIISDTDDFSTPKDVERQSLAIGDSLKETIKIPYAPFLHLELVYGIDADRFIYKRIIEILNASLYG